MPGILPLPASRSKDRLWICRIRVSASRSRLFWQLIVGSIVVSTFYHSFAVALKHGSVTGICCRQCCVLCIGATSNMVKHHQTSELQLPTISSGYRLQNCDSVTVGPNCLLASAKINHKFVPRLPQNLPRNIKKLLLEKMKISHPFELRVKE